MTSDKPTTGHFHAVGFYRDDESLCKIVADFLHEGFREGSPALVIGTPAHRDAVVARLRALGVQVDRLVKKGDLRLFDAEDVLRLFLKEGLPDATLFNKAMVPIMEEICRGRKACTIRAYGEMVDVLWQTGMHIAAIRLEMLWNQLANTKDFKLLCGYSMGSFYKDAATDSGYQDIRHQHTHIVPVGDEAATVN